MDLNKRHTIQHDKHITYTCLTFPQCRINWDCANIACKCHYIQFTPSSLILQQPEDSPTTAQLHTREIKGQQPMRPFSSAILTAMAQSEIATHLKSPIRQYKTWNREFRGLDGNCTTGPCCDELRWMTGDSEGCGWCMVVCERGDQGAGPEIACFNLCLWTWPCPSCTQAALTQAKFPLSSSPLTVCLSFWFLVFGRVNARYDDIIQQQKFGLHASQNTYSVSLLLWVFDSNLCELLQG